MGSKFDTKSQFSISFIKLTVMSRFFEIPNQSQNNLQSSLKNLKKVEKITLLSINMIDQRV